MKPPAVRSPARFVLASKLAPDLEACSNNKKRAPELTEVQPAVAYGCNSRGVTKKLHNTDSSTGWQPCKHIAPPLSIDKRDKVAPHCRVRFASALGSQARH
eukprot:Amastigsp_a678041_4.p2 type:complete len:101 gc:universal Amastigsp_a678041_4:265-567(+)